MVDYCACILIIIMMVLELMSLIHVTILPRVHWNVTRQFVVDQLVYFLFFMTSQLWCYTMARSISIGVQFISIVITKKIIKSDVESPYTYQKNDLNICNRFGHLDLALWTFRISKRKTKDFNEPSDEKQNGLVLYGFHFSSLVYCATVQVGGNESWWIIILRNIG